MFIPFSSSLIAILVVILLFILTKLLTSRSSTDREKISPFECGFDPKNNARTPFSLRFFMLAIIFLVFDIEIVLLIPTPIFYTMLNNYQTLSTAIIFLLILYLGLLHEWKEGSLNWTI